MTNLENAEFGIPYEEYFSFYTPEELSHALGIFALMDAEEARKLIFGGKRVIKDFHLKDN